MSVVPQRIQASVKTATKMNMMMNMMTRSRIQKPYTQQHPWNSNTIVINRFFQSSRTASIGQHNHCVAASDSDNGMIEVDIAVAGMVCDGCTSRVEEGLEKLDIVESAKADLEANKVTVALTAESFGEAAKQLERVVEAVNDMGFEANPSL